MNTANRKKKLDGIIPMIEVGGVLGIFEVAGPAVSRELLPDDTSGAAGINNVAGEGGEDMVGEHGLDCGTEYLCTSKTGVRLEVRLAIFVITCTAANTSFGSLISPSAFE